MRRCTIIKAMRFHQHVSCILRTRGLYCQFTSIPFPIIRNNDEMVKNIESFSYEEYNKTNVMTFLNAKGCIEDGHASERVVDLIRSVIDNVQQKKQEEITI